jgi:3-oxoacyl-ACP reductase-like protein
MGMLSNIFNKIFNRDAPADAAPAPAGSPAAAPAPTAAAPSQAAPAPVAMEEVDVEALLNGKAQARAEKLNWRTSIVDLLKLLDLDSSMAARKELAQELHFSGDTNDSASMNVWLHRQVMNKLAANGGKVPADLKD